MIVQYLDDGRRVKLVEGLVGEVATDVEFVGFEWRLQIDVTTLVFAGRRRRSRGQIVDTHVSLAGEARNATGQRQAAVRRVAHR